MPNERAYYVYIMASQSRVLYIGITNDLERRVFEHKNGQIPGFTSRYKITRLVWYESTNDVDEAIAFEKKLKLLGRGKKIVMIQERNPYWRDLSAEWQ